jgi:hypothetical protein
MRLCNVLCSATLATGLVESAVAEPIVTDRPDVTESSAVVERGLVQVEAGYTLVHFEQGQEELDVSSLPATLVRVGLVRGIELRFDWLGYVNESRKENGTRTEDSGAGGSAVGLKLALREEQGGAPQLALIADATLPSGSRSLRAERIDPALRLAASHTLSERLGLGYNVGLGALSVEDAGGDLDTHGLASYSVALGTGWGEKWATFVEIFGAVPTSGPGGPAHLLDGGATYLVSDTVQLDVSAGLGLSDDADDWFFGAGLSFRLPR